MRDELGDRMKKNYESRTKMFLPRRNYTLFRIDGKAFHTYTKGLTRPFDDDLMYDMDATAIELCENIQGAKFAFVQSDEISVLVTDFDTIDTQAWFDYNVQKMVSVSASIATAKFNGIRHSYYTQWYDAIPEGAPIPKDEQNYFMQYLQNAHFDSRVFQIADRAEVENYFIWRQQDTVRNSIQSVAQSLYSPKELHGVNTSKLQELIFQKGINWNDYEPRYKRGRVILKEEYKVGETTRTRWVMKEPPTFTQEREFLNALIPIR